MRRCILPTVASALFVAAILLPLLFVNRTQGELSQNENRYLQSFPSLRDEDGRFDLRRVLLIEGWLNDNIGFRHEAARLTAKAELGIFGCSPSAQVYAGREGWYYYTANDNMEIAYGGCQPDDGELAAMAEAQTNLQSLLAARGTDYILVLIPSKVSIYSEYIAGATQAGISPVDTVEQYLCEHTGLCVVNAKAALLGGKAAGRQVFYKTDSHWSEYGSYLGYTAIADALAELGKSVAPTPISVSSGTKQGDLVRLMGAESFLPREETETVTLAETKAAELTDDPISTEISALYDGAYDEVGWQGEPRLFRNDGAEGTALIFGDSFFNGFGSHTVECLAESYGLTVQVQTQIIRPEVLELVDPDIIIFETTERLISGLQYDPVQ